MGQGLKLWRNTCFCQFKPSLALNFDVPNLKGWPFQKYELQSFVFQNVPIWQRHVANQLGVFEYNFRCLKRFLRKVPRKLWLTFFLELRFLIIRLLVTWLKCLLHYVILYKQTLRNSWHIDLSLFNKRFLWIRAPFVKRLHLFIIFIFYNFIRNGSYLPQC